MLSCALYGVRGSGLHLGQAWLIRLSEGGWVSAHSKRNGIEASSVERGRSSGERVADGFDVVSVRIEDEGTVVVGVVSGAETWWAIVLAASL